MATAGQYGNILDMIALDAGEAAEFLAGAFGDEDDQADRGILPTGKVAPQAPASHGFATERENAPSYRRLKIYLHEQTLFWHILYLRKGR